MPLAGLGIDRIDDVILVGGTTKIPYVRDQVTQVLRQGAAHRRQPRGRRRRRRRAPGDLARAHPRAARRRRVERRSRPSRKTDTVVELHEIRVGNDRRSDATKIRAHERRQSRSTVRLRQACARAAAASRAATDRVLADTHADDRSPSRTREKPAPRPPPSRDSTGTASSALGPARRKSSPVVTPPPAPRTVADARRTTMFGVPAGRGR